MIEEGFEMATHVDNLFDAFPNDTPVIVIEDADSGERSSFMVCGLCGALVLESRHVTHARNQHPGDE